MKEELMEFYAAVKAAFPKARNYSVSIGINDYAGIPEVNYQASLYVGEGAVVYLSAVGKASVGEAIDGLGKELVKHDLEEKFRREFNERYAQAITSEVLP
jgi:hypothetical protein